MQAQSLRPRSIKDHYEITEKIDEGAFGYVYKANCLRTGDTVAIKQMKQFFADLPSALEIKEVKVLLQLDHPNVVKILDVHFYDGCLFIVYEFLVTDLLKFYTYYRDQVGSQEDPAFRELDPIDRDPDRPRAPLPPLSRLHSPRY
jgi:serine/threonine protein kinase